MNDEDADVVTARWECGRSLDAAVKATRAVRAFADRYGMPAERRAELSIAVFEVVVRVLDADGASLDKTVVEAATDRTWLTVRVERQRCCAALDDAVLLRWEALADRIEWSADEQLDSTVVTLEFPIETAWSAKSTRRDHRGRRHREPPQTRSVPVPWTRRPR